MAYATQDQVLQQLQGGQQQVDPTAARPIGSTGGGGIVDTSAGAAPQAGAGGQKMWTNIQSYLSAAQPQQAQRAQAVGQKGQEILQKGQQEFQAQKESTLGEAQKAASPVLSIGQDKASQLVQQATGAQKGTEAYTQALQPLKSALGAQYTAPKQFTFGVGRDVSELGRQAADESGFKNFLSQFDVGQQGGRGLSTGQRGLQEQLDVANPELEKVRQQVASQYQGLMGEQQAQSAEANKALQDIYGQFQTGQEALRGQLTGMGSQTMSDLEKAVAEQNKASQKADVDYQNYLNRLSAQETAAKQPFSTYGINQFSGLTNLSREDLAKLDPEAARKAAAIGPISTQQKQGMSPEQLNLYQYGAMLKYLDPSYQKQYLGAGNVTPEGLAARKQQIEAYKGMENYINALRNQPSYKKGAMADVATIGGKEQDVAKYNALMDLLGGKGIEQKAPVAGSTFNDKIGYKV